MQYIPDYIKATYADEATKGDYDLKVAVARAALLTHPQDKECLLANIAVFLQYSKRYEECIVHCKAALPQITDAAYYEEVQRFLAYALTSAGHLAEAIDFRKQLLLTTDDEYEQLEEIAKLYEELKDTDNTIKYYEMLYAFDDECTDEVHTKLAGLYDEKKDYENAAKHYELAAQKNMFDNKHLWAEAGRALALLERNEEAAFYFKMATKICPRDAMPHYYMGVLYQEKDDVYRAMHHYLEALKLQPDFAEVYNNMAAINYTEHSDIKEAIGMLKTALELSVHQNLLTTIYINLVRLHKQIGDFDQQKYYNNKLLESLGFPEDMLGDDDEEES